MNAGFNQLQNVLKEREEIEVANWNVRKNNNTQEYLDAVYSFRTVEDLRANRDALEQKRLSYGAQIDQNLTRGAIDDRLSTLMQQAQWAQPAERAAPTELKAKLEFSRAKPIPATPITQSAIDQFFKR